MKNWFKVLLLSIIGLQTVSAQSLELELLRTPEAPGFFTVRIFPDPSLQPIPLQNVFVKNYDQSRAEQYAELLPIIQELGGKIIERDDLINHNNAYNRITLLGGTRNPELLYFRTQEGADILETFDRFSRANLGPVYLKNIKAEFGGNISDVLPAQFNFMGESPAFFVGKFKKEMKTRLQLTATSSEGEITAITPLDLTHYEPHEFGDQLPEIWEDLYKQSIQTEEEPPIPGDTPWLNIFPWVLGLLGLIFIFIAIQTRRKNTVHTSKHELEDVPESFWHQPKEKVDEAMPFHIEYKKK